MVCVERVIREALQVGEVGVVAHGFEVFEHAADVVAGGAEDPFAVLGTRRLWSAGSGSGGGRDLSWRKWDLTGSVGRLPIYLALAGEHAADCRLRDGTQERVEHRRWRNWAAKTATPGP